MTSRLLADTEELHGEVVGVWFRDDRSGFAVIEVQADGDAEGVRCTGPLAAAVEGQVLRLVGRWADDDRWGATFEAVYYELPTPRSLDGLTAHLRGPEFVDVDRSDVERVVERFGLDTPDVVTHTPQRLVDEAGLSRASAERLHDAWIASTALPQLFQLVADVGWPAEAVRSAHDHFGARVLDVARDEPYRLLSAPRVRFVHVDRLARRRGTPPDDPDRLAAGACAAVGAARRDGHEHAPRHELVQASSRLLGVDPIIASTGIDRALTEGRLVADVVDATDVVTTPAAIATERSLADAFVALVRGTTSRLTAAADREGVADDLTDDQRRAVQGIVDHRVSVLTGGAGTGKTRTLEEVVRVVLAAGLEIALCAPTGRAARHLEAVTGAAASTIHRLLEARPDGDGGFTFSYGVDRRLPHDLVVVDEVSMCDTSLTNHLVQAVDVGSHLLLVGDAEQLPSVGPGNVLRDVIASGVVPTFRLEQIHRQAARSRISGLAREILEGRVGDLPGVDGDVYFAEESDTRAVADRVVRAVVERAPEHLGVDSDDVQVLAPMYGGPAGVDGLNAALRMALNPPTGRAVAGFEVGDRVMATRNDVERQVANGDIGRVADVDLRDRVLTVSMPTGDVEYPAAACRDLVHAWAVTVHKSQGGEWPVVVLVVDGAHRRMLHRNLLYTAVTRARDALVIVGQRHAVATAAATVDSAARHTGLTARLVDASRRPQ
ncbi:MAG: AAA family ATPase [Nitriliruptoraceae bacterium]